MFREALGEWAVIRFEIARKHRDITQTESFRPERTYPPRNRIRLGPAIRCFEKFDSRSRLFRSAFLIECPLQRREAEVRFKSTLIFQHDRRPDLDPRLRQRQIQPAICLFGAVEEVQLTGDLSRMMECGTAGMNQQADLDLLNRFGERYQQPAVVFIEFEKAVDVNSGLAQEPALFDRTQHMRCPPMLIEPFLTQIGVVFPVHQCDVAQLRQQRVRIDIPASRLFDRLDHRRQFIGSFSTAFQLGECLVELRRQPHPAPIRRRAGASAPACAAGVPGSSAGPAA